MVAVEDRSKGKSAIAQTFDDALGIQLDDRLRVEAATAPPVSHS